MWVLSEHRSYLYPGRQMGGNVRRNVIRREWKRKEKIER